MFAINHCIRRANSGAREMEHELLNLYRRALDAGSLFENGVLSRFTYHNIAATGLRCGELDWAETFIHRYNDRLERQYRESSLSFNLARLEYARRRFDSVLTLLQKANYNDPLLHLAAKTLLLKTYFVYLRRVRPAPCAPRCHAQLHPPKKSAGLPPEKLPEHHPVYRTAPPARP